jgi:hypothetical protein
MAVVHFVRSPLDIVVSAFWFHTEEVAPEEWIKREVGAWCMVCWVWGEAGPRAVGCTEEVAPADWIKRAVGG